MKIAMIGPFGINYPDSDLVKNGSFVGHKGTTSLRILPLARALKAKGHSPRIILPPFQPESIKKDNVNINGLDVTNVPLNKRLGIKDHVFATFRMLSKALNEKPDVIHVFKPKGESGLVAMISRLLRKIGLDKTPLVVDVDDWEGYGGWNDVINSGPVTKDFFEFQERNIPPRVGGITAASNYLRNRFSKVNPNVIYVPNGPSPLRYGPKDKFPSSAELRRGLGIPRNNKVVLLYTQFKDFSLSKMARSLSNILKDDPKVSLLVVGSGQNKEEYRLKRALSGKGISEDRVVLVHFVPIDRVMKYLALGDVAVFPYDDNKITRSKCSPRLIDLMVVRVPVVASDVGENTHYLDQGRCGLLVHGYEEFPEMVFQVLEDAGLGKRLGKNAHERIWKHFNWQNLVVKVEDQYSDLSGRGR